jgi:hypothetical protein
MGTRIRERDGERIFKEAASLAVAGHIVAVSLARSNRAAALLRAAARSETRRRSVRFIDPNP